MIKEQGNGTITLGQSHARMLLNWAEAADVGDSGNSREPEEAPVGEGRKSWDVLGVRFQMCNSWKLSHWEGLQASQWTGQA